MRRVLRSERRTITQHDMLEPVSRYVTHDAHHSQAHSQQRTITQDDMLPQHPVDIKELFCECF